MNTLNTLEKAYQSAAVEAKWYPAWVENGCFTGKADPSKEAFCIMIPPPNVTGVLTMGHVLNNTIQDVLIRRARQQGKAALWLPGTDHAGIATQTRVERELAKEGKTKYDLGREAFLEHVAKWRDEHGGIIIEQLKRLGTSCDWARSVHTLDDDYSASVLTAFVKLYEKGFVYRGKRMINWCPKSQTALSDEEVFSRTEASTLYKVRWELVEFPGEYLEVCTQRPETIPGDVALAVHPEDERYTRYIGCHVWRPFVRAQIPIIADAAVERDFGTGILKVTPAHALMDFEISQRHNLSPIDILNSDGTLNALAGPDLAGLDRFKAREKAASLLEGLGLLAARLPYETNLPYSERGDVPVEPRLSEQWFLRYPRIEEAKAVVQSGLIKFHPDRWTKTYLHWLDKIQDWCISRQIWWGHRIPVWYKKGADKQNPANWHVSVTGPADPENWDQDEDTFDTWASSWLWPFATLGWPDADAEAAKDFKYWFPTNDLVTGPDIIFFWVARMIIASLELVGPSPDRTLTQEECAARLPFNNVYFTGIIRDAQGRKMSKSLGNSPDPLDLIAQYGADGLRFGILSMAPQGQDIFFNESGISQGRNFCNKLWNAARFREMSGPSGDCSSVEVILQRFNAAQMDGDDHAIVARLVDVTQAVDSLLANYEFSQATQAIYSFFWGDYCDWYLEVAKSRLQDAAAQPHVLAIQDLVIRQVLLLLHPFAPFITEELWHGRGYSAHEKDFIQNHAPMSAMALGKAFTAVNILIDTQAAVQMEEMRLFVSQARALKAQYGLQSQKAVRFVIQLVDDKASLLIQNQSKLLKLIGAEAIAQALEDAVGPSTVTPWGTLTLCLDAAVDVGAERARLTKELARLEKAIIAGESKVNSPEFVVKAPAHILEGAKAQLFDTQTKHQEVARLLNSLPATVA